MVVVIFEVLPKEEFKSEYFDLAEKLKPSLQKVKGFISIERFHSITTPGKILSISFWEDEESIKMWRELKNHRHAQEVGRSKIFADYRLRIAAVIRDYGMFERAEAPEYI